MADTINDKTETQTTTTSPIRTLVFEYAKAPNYQCQVCHKSILARSLCIATIERANKKQKKKLLKPLNTTHFKCWTVPEEFRTQPKPLEFFRGFTGLKPSDKKRIERMKEGGAGTTWAALMAADEAEKQEQEQQEELEQLDEDKKKPKPTKRKQIDNDEEDTDMTLALTGGQTKQVSSNKKAKTTTTTEADDESMTATKEIKVAVKKETKVTAKKDTKTSNNNKKKESSKKKEPKEVNKKKAPKQLDEIHGEGFENDFNQLLNDFK